MVKYNGKTYDIDLVGFIKDGCFIEDYDNHDQLKSDIRYQCNDCIENDDYGLGFLRDDDDFPQEEFEKIAIDEIEAIIEEKASFISELSETAKRNKKLLKYISEDEIEAILS